MHEIVALLSTPTLDNAEFWTASDHEELRLPYCPACGRFHYFPRRHCPYCGNEAIEWRKALGEGTVYSFSHVHFSPFGETWAREIPYCVAQIDLAEGVRMLTRIVGDNRSDVRIGDAVKVTFAKVEGSDRKIPVFVLKHRSATDEVKK